MKAPSANMTWRLAATIQGLGFVARDPSTRRTLPGALVRRRLGSGEAGVEVVDRRRAEVRWRSERSLNLAAAVAHRITRARRPCVLPPRLTSPPESRGRVVFVAGGGVGHWRRGRHPASPQARTSNEHRRGQQEGATHGKCGRDPPASPIVPCAKRLHQRARRGGDNREMRLASSLEGFHRRSVRRVRRVHPSFVFWQRGKDLNGFSDLRALTTDARSTRSSSAETDVHPRPSRMSRSSTFAA